MEREPSARERWSELLWRIWGSFGVSAWSREGAAAPVDPEALVVLTEVLDDLRLSRETIDWAVTHAHLLSPSRLRHFAQVAGVDERVEQWIATVATHTAAARWKARPELVLEGFVPSGKSRSYSQTPLEDAAATVLRFRSLVGTTVRGETIRALHAVARGAQGPLSTAQVANRTASTAAQVLPILDELVAAGIVRQVGSPRRRQYAPRMDQALSRATWQAWTELPFAPWHDAVGAVPTLLAMLRLAGGAGAGDDPEAVATVLDRYLAAADVLSAADGTVHPIHRPAGASQLAVQLATIAEHSLDAVIARLDGGAGAARMSE